MRSRRGLRHAFLRLAVVAMMISVGLIVSMPAVVGPPASARASGRLSGGLASTTFTVAQAGIFRVSSAPVPSPLAVSSNLVVVTTTADVVNSAVSSVAALNANPGADGISLREALKAADATGGSATVYIMFSAALNGATIDVLAELPPITRDHVVLEGVAPDGSRARVALDGRAASASLSELLYVEASEVTVRWLRFTGVDPKRSSASRVTAVVVRPGTYMRGAPPYPPGPSLVANVQIVDDVFDNSAVPLLWMPTDPIAMGLYVGSQGTPNTHVSGITIARNTFRNYGDTTVGVFATDSGATADAVAIVDNTFEGNSIPIELGDGSSNGERITGTRIIGNTITGSNTVAGGGAGGINLDTGAVNGTIDQTLIEDNVLSGLKGSILLNAAAAAPGQLGTDTRRRCDLEHADRQQRHPSRGRRHLHRGRQRHQLAFQSRVRGHDRERHARRRPVPAGEPLHRHSERGRR